MVGKQGSRRLAACLIAVLALFRSAALAAEPDLRALVEAARAAGSDADFVGRVTLVDATSRYLKRIEGDIDFPFQVGLDLPIDAAPMELGSALTGPASATGRYVVVFDVALAKVSRRVRDMKERVSQKVTTLGKIDNPAFVRAVREYDRASIRLEKRPGDGRLVKAAEEARAKMTSTPQYIEKPTYGGYVYRLADVEGKKALSVTYYLVDRVAGRYMKSVIDVVENERFILAYDLDPTDPAPASDFVREQQVRDWERAPVMIELSRLLDHALAQGGPNQSDGNLLALLGEVARERSRAVARAEADIYDQRPLNDPRFDSVVAIYTPQGMGSGFFVRSNIVMTNWHVVEDRPIVELRLYDKRETFGQVIAKDVLLDLALVKVQDRGRVVAFHQGNELTPGERVDAIGHPKRRLFSITRGVVSAVRKLSSHSLGGREVLYVQTDADLNPGNSGGPLFKGDKVVGVNAWAELHGRVTSGEKSVIVPAPGLNFAVHYAEAKRFLDEAMKGE